MVGYDDLMFAPYTIPALTTLRMPTTEIVAEAVRTAVALVADRAATPAPIRTIFEPTLIVRRSTAPPPGRPVVPVRQGSPSVQAVLPVRGHASRGTW